jgi:hypothetical protein
MPDAAEKHLIERNSSLYAHAAMPWCLYLSVAQVTDTCRSKESILPVPDHATYKTDLSLTDRRRAPHTEFMAVRAFLSTPPP